MATATEAPESLQTVAEVATEAAEADVFQNFAKQFAGETEGQEAPTEAQAPEGDKTTDLSQSTEAPEQPPEATTEDQPPAENADESDDDDDGLTEELKERINKRIGKEVAKRKAEQERSAALEARIAELEAKAKEPTPKPDEDKDKEKPQAPNPAQQATEAIIQQDKEIQKVASELQQTEQFYNQATDLVRRLRRDPDGVMAVLKKGGIEVADEDDARQTLETLRENSSRKWHQLSTKHEVMRERFVAKLETTRTANRQSTAKLYPWLDNPKSAEMQIASRIVEQFPGLPHLPDGWRMIARLVAGEMAEAKAAAKPAATTTPPKPPPKLPGAAKAAAPAPTKQTQKTAATQQVAERAMSGEIEDVKDYIAAHLTD